MELLALFSILLVPCACLATDFKYYFALPPNHPSFIDEVNLRIHISTHSTSNVNITVRIKGKILLQGSVNATHSLNVTGQEYTNLIVNSSDYSNRHKGILVEASDEVVVTPVTSLFLSTGASTDTFRVLRSHPRDKMFSYYAAAAGSKNHNLYSYVILVGQSNDTHVTVQAFGNANIEVPNDLYNAEAGMDEGTGSFEFVLNEYETLLIPSTGNDLTGTYVYGTHPLTILGGHQCANIPSNSTTCDQVVTQIPPMERWGNEFLLTPLEGRTSGQYHRVIAGHEHTTLHHNCRGHDSTHVLEWPGESVDISTDFLTSCYLTSDNPVLVVVMSLGNLDEKGDAAISVIPPFGQYRKDRVTFFALDDVQFPHQFITVKSTLIQPRSLTLDSKPLLCDWFIIWNLDYSAPKGYACNVKIGVGVHSIAHNDVDGQGKFSVVVYGFHNERKQGYVYSSVSEWIAPQEPVSPPMIHLEETFYNAHEEDGMVLSIPIASSNIEHSTSVIVTCTQGTADTNDYTLTTSNIVTLDPNEPFAYIDIEISNDNFVEAKETFVVSITSNDVEVGLPSEATVTITDDDFMEIGYETDVNNGRVRVYVKNGFFEQKDAIVTCGFFYMEDASPPGPYFTELQFTHNKTSYSFGNITLGYLTVIDSHDFTVVIPSPEIVLPTFDQQPSNCTITPGMTPLPQSTPPVVTCSPSNVVTEVTITQVCSLTDTKTLSTSIQHTSLLRSTSSEVASTSSVLSSSSVSSIGPPASTSSINLSSSNGPSSTDGPSSTPTAVQSVPHTSVPVPASSSSVKRVPESSQQPRASSWAQRPARSTSSVLVSQTRPVPNTPGVAFDAVKETDDSFDQLVMVLAILLPLVVCVFVIVSIVLCVLCYKRGQRTGHYKLAAVPSAANL